MIHVITAQLNVSDSRAEAEGLLEQEREIRRKKNKLFQILIHDAELKTEKLQSEKSKAETELESRRAFLREEERRLKQIEEDNSVVAAEHERLSSSLQKTNAELAAFERRDIKLKEDLKHVSSQIKKLNAAIAKDHKKEADSTAEMENLQKLVNICHYRDRC